ncbi:MAG: hypothetical protein Q9187_004822 [Circinaria calcarea]
MASHPSFLGLALETKKRIYVYVLFRPCEVDRMGNSPGQLKTVKDWLHDVDTALLSVNKQTYAEVVPLAFECNTFTWPGELVTEYRPFLQSLVHRIRRIFVTHYALSKISHGFKAGKKLGNIKQYFPQRLTHVIVNAYTYRFTDMADMILRDIIRVEKWVALLLDLQRLKRVQIRFLQHGQLHDELDMALEGKFPGCIMSKSEAGPEFDYRSQPGFQEDYSDDFNIFSSGSDDQSDLDLAARVGLEKEHIEASILMKLLRRNDSEWETCSEGDAGTDGKGKHDAHNGAQTGGVGTESAEVDYAETDNVEANNAESKDGEIEGAETGEGG